MGTLLCRNNYIAVEPFATSATKLKVESNFATILQKGTLTPLKVVHGNLELKAQPGDTVWVRADVAKHEQSKQVFESPGGPFILLQTSLVMMVEQAE